MTDSHIGYTIYISEELPATNDATGFEALTWTEATGWQQLPQFGVTHDGIDIPDGKLGFTKSAKGAGKGQSSEMKFRQIASDAGHAIILAQAIDQDGDISIKIGKGSGTANALAEGDPVEYAQGYVHSYLPIQGTNSSYEGFAVMFQQNDYTVTGTEPAA